MKATFACVWILIVTSAAGAQTVEAVRMRVKDMERAAAFYTVVLSFRQISGAGDTMETRTLALGDERVQLDRCLECVARIDEVRSNDLSFQHIAIVVSDMDEAYERLRFYHVKHVSPAPQTLPVWNPQAAGIRAFYFQDPDGHNLELIEFPSGKGQSKWHHMPGLFLGIDHTAVVVSSTSASLKFYREELGFEITAESENYGPEQERLNNVAGAHLRITTLRGSRGPGVEFLEYIAPTGRRLQSFPRSHMDVNDTVTLVKLETNDFTVSGRTGLLRDPDGHAVEVGR